MRTLPFVLALSSVMPAAANGLAFDERIIDAGFHIEQPALVGNLTGDDRHVVLAGRNDEHEQRIAVFAIDDPDAPVLQL